jgi:glyoxylase-like metal-dependent hydrolase (beta-lactamase superfamily II)
MTSPEFEVFGRVSIGVIVADGEAFIIDSGLDENEIRKVINGLVQREIKIKGLLLTHSHSDHSGGAFYAQKRGIPIYASPLETSVLQHPELLNVLISGFNNSLISGSKFVTPQKFNPVGIEASLTLSDSILTPVDLKGHTLGQIGYECNGILFAGDAFFSMETLEAHPIPYMLDARSFLESLAKLRSYDGKIVISHGGLVSDKNRIIDFNIERINGIADFVRDKSVNGIEMNTLIKLALSHFNSKRDILGYFLDSTTIKSIAFSFSKIKLSDGEVIVSTA